MTELFLVGALFAAGIYLSKNGQNPLTTVMSAIDSSIFPLKIGANNGFVSNVQKALINKGGEIAQLILGDGGVTGVYTATTAKAVQLAGYNAELSETEYKRLVGNSQVLRNIAYVVDVGGAPLFSSVGDSYIPEYGYGRDLIMTLPIRTHLGTATGNFNNGLIELTTTINVNKVKFWVPTSKINLVSQSEYDSIKNSKILPKSDEARAKLLKL